MMYGGARFAVHAPHTTRMSTLTLAGRALRRSPSFAAAAALTLSIGIGATTAIFTVLDTVLLKPLAYPRARTPRRRVVRAARHGIQGRASVGGELLHLSPLLPVDRRNRRRRPLVGELRERRRYDGSRARARGRRLRECVHPARRGIRARSRIYRRRGHPAGNAGRRAERRTLASPIRRGPGHRRQGGYASTDAQRTVVGVAPESFRFPDAVTQLWLPIALDSAATFGGSFGHQSFVRLKPGVSLQALQTELNHLTPRIAELYPDIAPGLSTKGFLTGTRASVVIHPMRDDVVGNFGKHREHRGGGGHSAAAHFVRQRRESAAHARRRSSARARRASRTRRRPSARRDAVPRRIDATRDDRRRIRIGARVHRRALVRALGSAGNSSPRRNGRRRTRRRVRDAGHGADGGAVQRCARTSLRHAAPCLTAARRRARRNDRARSSAHAPHLRRHAGCVRDGARVRQRLAVSQSRAIARHSAGVRRRAHARTCDSRSPARRIAPTRMSFASPASSSTACATCREFASRACRPKCRSTTSA